MPQELVRVRVDRRETNVGKAFAETKGLTVLDEPTHNEDGTPRRETRLEGRSTRKPKTTVADAAAKKQGAGSESAPTEKEKTDARSAS